MEGLLHRAADGKLRGLAKWYAWAHIHRCAGCTAFMRRLEATLLALRAARGASQDLDALNRLRDHVRALSEAEADSRRPRPPD
jgi:hypothetical protein